MSARPGIDRISRPHDGNDGAKSANPDQPTGSATSTFPNDTLLHVPDLGVAELSINLGPLDLK